jgi:FlaA1/EpsC-like NDP-sugar epimerase
MISLAGFVPDKDIKIEYTGLRLGEKLYEEVLSNAENTLPSFHEKIRVAKVREYQDDSASAVVEELERLTKAVDIPALVRLMKDTVPEFKSKNSEFEKYDKN